jgi:hypothetical protein
MRFDDSKFYTEKNVQSLHEVQKLAALTVYL